MNKKVRTIVVDGTEIQTSLSAIEIAGLPLKNAELKEKIDNALDKIDALIIFWKQYSPDNTLEIGQLENLKSILTGKSNE